MPAVEARRREAPPAPAEERVVLTGVRWSTYESLLADTVDRNVPRMTYDEGVLELMTPSSEHERVNRILALLIDVVAEEWQIDVVDLGSTTCVREEQKRGLEPDTCFYVQHEAAVRGKETLDLSVDPPPDLAIEITRGAIPSCLCTLPSACQTCGGTMAHESVFSHSRIEPTIPALTALPFRS